jgi:hypothetical protein
MAGESPRPSLPERVLLLGNQMPDPDFGKLEEFRKLLIIERRFLAGTLNFYEPILARHDDVHIDIGPHILGVIEIQARLPVNDPNTDGCD